MHSSDTELKAYEYEPSVAYIVTLTLMVPCRAVQDPKSKSFNEIRKTCRTRPLYTDLLYS